jgi:hypothetical protein
MRGLAIKTPESFTGLNFPYPFEPKDISDSLGEAQTHALCARLEFVARKVLSGGFGGAFAEK